MTSETVLLLLCTRLVYITIVIIVMAVDAFLAMTLVFRLIPVRVHLTWHSTVTIL